MFFLVHSPWTIDHSEEHSLTYIQLFPKLSLPWTMDYGLWSMDHAPQLTFLYTQKVDYCLVMDVIFNIIHRRLA